MNTGIIFPELSYSIIGCAMDVHNKLGPCWDEWDYHRAMILALEAKGHDVSSHDRRDLLFRDQVVDQFELDILVDDSIILELKHIRADFHPEHFTQIINYLKQWDRRLGILINFGLERLAYKRVPFDPVLGGVHMSGKWFLLESCEQELCADVISSIESILQEVGYGYGVSIFQNVLIRELSCRDLNAIRPICAPRYERTVFESREVNGVLLDSKILIFISASGNDASSADVAYLKSFMRHLNISHGILIDIGRSEIQVKGVL